MAAEKGEKAGGEDTHAAGREIEAAAAAPDRPARGVTARDRAKAALRAALPADAETGESLAPSRGPGRPKGSRNLRTEKVARELVATYGDPLEADVAIGTMPAGELVTMLRMIASDRGIKMGMTLKEVLALQRECRAAAMPYIHAKRAAEDAKGETVVPQIVFGTFAQSGRVGRSVEDVIDGEPATEINEDNQGVAELPAPKSDE